jgi:hypothetical protein
VTSRTAGGTDLRNQQKFARFRLEESEQVIWTGRPSVFKGYSKIGKFIMIFGILMGAGFVAPTWIFIDNYLYFKVTDGEFLFAEYYGAVILAIGWLIVLFLVVGRSIVKAFAKSGIRYSITNHRIIETRRRRPIVVQELRRQDLSSRVVINKKGKVGTIQFNQRSTSGSPFAVLWLEIPFIHKKARQLTLFDVVDVNEALTAIDEV